MISAREIRESGDGLGMSGGRGLCSLCSVNQCGHMWPKCGQNVAKMWPRCAVLLSLPVQMSVW